MEFRQLEAFVAVATELHFGRAAEKLQMSQPTLSELIRRLEREIGTPLLTRTTRRVALTGAGAELLGRARGIVDDVSAATAAVRRVATGEAGTVRLGIVPNVEPVLAPHVTAALARRAPDVEIDVHRMWPPDLLAAVIDGSIDVGITCGYVADPPSVASETFCAESVLAALRSTHRLAGGSSVAWVDLAGETLGLPSVSLFPDWSWSQQRILDTANISPPSIELDTTDVAATGWTTQCEVDWVMTGAALGERDDGVAVMPITPERVFPYKLLWSSARTQTAAAARFVQLALTVDVPRGWVTQPGHLRHDEAASNSKYPAVD